jgi:hypothetical protein
VADERRQPTTESHEVAHMQTFFSFDAEIAHRRREWQRAMEADARAAQARPATRHVRWPRLGRLTLANVRSVPVPRLSFTARLEPGCRTVAC